MSLFWGGKYIQKMNKLISFFACTREKNLNSFLILQGLAVGSPIKNDSTEPACRAVAAENRLLMQDRTK